MRRSYTIDFYNQPIPRDTRTCSFGYGSKYFFQKAPNNPSSSTYNLPAERKRGISFGTGRDVCFHLSRKSSLATTSINPSNKQYAIALFRTKLDLPIIPIPAQQASLGRALRAQWATRTLLIPSSSLTSIPSPPNMIQI